MEEKITIFKKVVEEIENGKSIIQQVPFDQLKLDLCLEEIHSLSICSVPERSFFQVKVLAQSDNDSCGYYALHNAVVMYHSLHSSSFYLPLLQSNTSLWKHYDYFMDKLFKKSEQIGTKGWPWSKETIKEGLMERIYLHHLIYENNSHFPSTDCTSFHFGFAHLLHSSYQILDLHSTFEKIRQMENGCHIFFLGVLTHWTCLLVTKHNRKLTFFYMDSLNRLSLTETQEDIEKWLVEAEIEREKSGKKKWTVQQREFAKQSRIDAKLALEFLIKCLQGENVISLYFNEHISRFLRSYKEHVGEIVTDVSQFSDSHLSKLNYWTKEFWHPSIIRDSLLLELRLFGSKHLNSENFEQFELWCKIHSELKHEKLCGVAQLMYEILKLPVSNM